MYQHLLSILSFLALTSTVRALEIVAPSSPNATDSTVLHPISIADYESAFGIHRRASDISHLKLQTHAEMIYGSPKDNGKLLLANMRLYAPDGLLLITMERFEGLTASVDCRGDSGTMSLTFNSKDAFDQALQEWSYINNNDNGKFLLIANHDGCGPANERQPYYISQITEDTSTLTTHLAANPAPWSEVAGTFDFDFGHKIPAPQPRRIKARGKIPNAVTKATRSIIDTLEGSMDKSKTVSFPVNVGQKGHSTNIYTDSKGHITLDCVNCFMTGSFDITGHFAVKKFKPEDVIFTASPKGVQAELELEAKVSSNSAPETLSHTTELFSQGVPGAGMEIKDILKIGATFSYDVTVKASYSGSATVDFGLQASLPDSAKLTADLLHKDSSSATGFDGGSLKPIFDVTEASASITLAAISQPILAFGVELLTWGKFDLVMPINLPEVSTTLTAAYDEAGVCSHDAGASKTGVKLDSEVIFEVDLQVDDSVSQKAGTPAWSKVLFEKSVPLPSRCFPIHIPGLAPASDTTTAATSTATPNASLSSATALASGGVRSGNHTVPMSPTANATIPMPSAANATIPASSAVFGTATGVPKARSLRLSNREAVNAHSSHVKVDGRYFVRGNNKVWT